MHILDIFVFLEQIKSFLFEKCCDPKAGQSLYRISLLPTGSGIRVGSSRHEEDFYHVYNYTAKRQYPRLPRR